MQRSSTIGQFMQISEDGSSRGEYSFLNLMQKYQRENEGNSRGSSNAEFTVQSMQKKT